MSAKFDAYHKWLGIPPSEQPPNHYRLLGVPLFESDADVIANAADRAMAHLRTFQAGPYSAESQQLLNEVAAARVCLLNPARKAVYDNELRARRMPAAPPRQAAPRMATPLPVAAPIAIADVQPISNAGNAAPTFDFEDEFATSHRSRRRRRNNSSAGGAIGMLVFLVAAGGIGFIAWRSLSKKPEDNGPTKRESRPTAVKPAPEKSQSDTNKISTTPTSVLPSSNSDLKTNKAADRLLEQVAVAVREGRIERTAGAGGSGGGPFEDLPKPAALLIGLEVGHDADTIRSIRPIFMTSNHRTVHGPVHGRHDSVVSEIAKPGYAVGGISVRRGDRLDGMSIIFMRITPHGLDPRDSYGSKWIGGQGGGPMQLAGDGSPVVGVFGGVGDWLDRIGLIVARLDGRKRPKTSDEDLVSSPSVSEDMPLSDQEDPREVKLPEGLPFSTRPTTNRKPPPSDEEHAAALKTIRELFEKKYAEAKTPAKKFELANELFRQGRDTHDDLAARYVLFEEARRLAAAACAPQGILDAVVAMAADFEIDDVEMTVDSFEASAKSTADAAQKKLLAESSLGLIDEAVRRKRFDAARRLSAVARSAASKASDAALISAAGARAKRLKEQQTAYEAAASSLEAVAVAPDDAEANFLAGRFRALVEEQWSEALPMLVKGSNVDYKQSAELELKHESSAESAAAIGDAWHEIPEDDPFYKRLCRTRAAYWYRIAVSELTGLAKARIEKRLEELSSSEK